LKKSRHVKICLFEGPFKKGLRAKELNRPEEVPCSDLKYVELANRLGMSKDRCIELLGHIFQYIFGLASQGHRMEIAVPGVGALWAKSAAIGFRFRIKKQVSMSKSKRSNAGSYKDSLDLKGESPFLKKEVEENFDNEEQEVEDIYDEDEQEEEEEEKSIDRVENLLRNIEELTPPSSTTTTTKTTPSSSPLPMFLRPEVCRSPFTDSKLRGIKSRSRYAIEKAYERHRDALELEQARLNNQEQRIRDRLVASDSGYFDRQDRERSQRQEYARALLEQAARKREKDQRERYERSQLCHEDPSRVMPQEKRSNKTQHIKLKLRKILDRQVEIQKRRHKEERRRQIAEENFFLGCIHKQMIDDRVQRTELKRQQAEELKSAWERQIEVNKKKNKVLSAVYSSV